MPKQSSRMHDWCGFEEIASLRNARDDELNRFFGTDTNYCFDSLEVSMNFTIEFEQEEDGRWIAEVLDLDGVLAYG